MKKQVAADSATKDAFDLFLEGVEFEKLKGVLPVLYETGANFFQKDGSADECVAVVLNALGDKFGPVTTKHLQNASEFCRKAAWKIDELADALRDAANAKCSARGTLH